MAIEYLIIFAIVLAQAWSFYRTHQAIGLFRLLFPQRPALSIGPKTFPAEFLKTNSPDDILDLLHAGKLPPLNDADTEQHVPIGLVFVMGGSADFRIILKSINTYLLRNSGAAADFNLMRDIAERQNDAAEDRITSSVSVPLYLGLAGTLIGIVVGLYNISDLSGASGTESAALLDQAIPTLLGGVKVAMLASLSGLLLTVLNNAFFYKRAKAENAARRNGFYTFLQVELLPVINQNLDSTLRSLQANLLQFNDGFGKNMGKLDSLMSKNYDALIAQSGLLDTLQELDMMQMAQANVKVLKELQKAAHSFEGFNAYLTQVNSIFNGTTLSLVKINEFLDRTKNLEALASRAVDAADMNRQLMAFLQSHYSELDKSRQLIADSVTDVNGTLQSALDDLHQFTRDKVDQIRSLETAEEARIAADYQHRWASLAHLKRLEELPGAISRGAASSNEQLVQLTKEIVALRAALVQELAALRKEQQSDDGRFAPNRIFSTLFIRKNPTDEKA